MALGFVAYGVDGNEIFTGHRFCGKNGTSNISEYRALIAGLEKSIKMGVNVIHVIGDSQLIIKQVTGAFKINKLKLQEHCNRVLELLEQFDYYTIKWMPRKENKRADALVNDVFAKRSGKCLKKQRK